MNSHWIGEKRQCRGAAPLIEAGQVCLGIEVLAANPPHYHM